MSDLRKAAQAAVDLWHLNALGDVDMEYLRAALAQPEQEPVAHRIFDGEGGYVFVDGDPSEFEVEWSARYRRKYEPLYEAPPQRKPLTNGEIYTAYITATNQTLRAQDEKLALEFARAIEQAHGIGGEHE